MIVLDTNVFAYAVGSEHPLREPCRAVLRTHADGLIEVTTTVEVLQEFLHVRARRRPRVEAVALVRSLMNGLTPLVTTSEDLQRGLDLFDLSGTLDAFDCVLAAVALNHNAEALISADGAFREIHGLRWVDPSTTGLYELIGQ